MESAPDLLYVQKELYRMFATSNEKKIVADATAFPVKQVF